MSCWILSRRNMNYICFFTLKKCSADGMSPLSIANIPRLNNARSLLGSSCSKCFKRLVASRRRHWVTSTLTSFWEGSVSPSYADKSACFCEYFKVKEAQIFVCLRLNGLYRWRPFLVGRLLNWAGTPGGPAPILKLVQDKRELDSACLVLTKPLPTVKQIEKFRKIWDTNNFKKKFNSRCSICLDCSGRKTGLSRTLPELPWSWKWNWSCQKVIV